MENKKFKKFKIFKFKKFKKITKFKKFKKNIKIHSKTHTETTGLTPCTV
jgi:hypothetical protein